MSIVLIDSSSSSLTVSWPEVAGAQRYILQYKQGENSNFENLSDKLRLTLVRKRNLSGTDGFFFRVKGVVNDDENANDWIGHVDGFNLLTTEQELKRLEVPTVEPSGAQAAIITWKDNYDSTRENKYELQMRENKGGQSWNTVASALANTQVRKKNLVHSSGYQFRVRVSNYSNNEEENNNPCVFSPPSEVQVFPGLPPAIKNLFSNINLQKGSKNLSVPDALGGKDFILVYMSAHWCPPCRQFTPQLISFYNTYAKQNRLEIVFASNDHDSQSFDNYFRSMPWLAIPFDEDEVRDQLMGYFRVQGIPRLVVLDGKTGRILEDNAVGKPLDVTRWRTLARSR